MPRKCGSCGGTNVTPAAGCQCSVIPGANTTITGTGDAGDPFVINTPSDSLVVNADGTHTHTAVDGTVTIVPAAVHNATISDTIPNTTGTTIGGTGTVADPYLFPGWVGQFDAALNPVDNALVTGTGTAADPFQFPLESALALTTNGTLLGVTPNVADDHIVDIIVTSASPNQQLAIGADGGTFGQWVNLDGEPYAAVNGVVTIPNCCPVSWDSAGGGTPAVPGDSLANHVAYDPTTGAISHVWNVTTQAWVPVAAGGALGFVDHHATTLGDQTGVVIPLDDSLVIGAGHVPAGEIGVSAMASLDAGVPVTDTHHLQAVIASQTSSAIGDFGLPAVAIAAQNATVTGRHSIAGGLDNTSSGQNLFVTGTGNTSAGVGNVVSGTTNNVDNGSNWSLSVGRANTLTGTQEVIVGGNNNTVTGANGSLVGGRTNTVTAAASMVVGDSNIVGGDLNIVGGSGNNLSADTFRAVISGVGNTSVGGVGAGPNLIVGSTNTVTATNANAIHGDSNNIINGGGNVVNGANHNLTNVFNSTVTGNNNTLTAGGNKVESIVVGNNNVITDSIDNSIIIGAAHNVQGQKVAVTGEGHNVGQNAVTQSPLVGGQFNTIDGTDGFVTGQNNTVAADHSSILGGFGNTIGAAFNLSAIIGGSGIVAAAANTVYVPRLNIAQIPTTAVGLLPGDVWNNGGVLNIV